LEYGSTNKRLYIGNLSWTTTEEGLGQALGQNGRTVASVKIKTDTKTGRSRGFAFAELGSEEEVHAAIEELHGTELDGRPLKVSTANVKKVHTGGFVQRMLKRSFLLTNGLNSCKRNLTPVHGK
jgi:RNA recognition motif-containing protein